MPIPIHALPSSSRSCSVRAYYYSLSLHPSSPSHSHYDSPPTSITTTFNHDQKITKKAKPFTVLLVASKISLLVCRVNYTLCYPSLGFCSSPKPTRLSSASRPKLPYLTSPYFTSLYFTLSSSPTSPSPVHLSSLPSCLLGLIEFDSIDSRGTCWLPGSLS